MSVTAGDPLQTFAPGEPIAALRADTANAWTEAARQARKGRRAGAASGGDRPNPGSLEILVRNDTGGDLAAMSVVQVSYPLQIPTVYGTDIQRGPAFAGIVATGTAGTPAVLTEPVEDGTTGRAVVMGVALVSVDITDAGHTRATLDTGETAALVSGTSGPATILWRETGTGVKLCAVLLCCGTGIPAVGDAEDWEYPPDGDPATLSACNGNDVALPLAWLEFSDKTGTATGLPERVPLTRIPALDSSGGVHVGNPPGWIVQGASQAAGIYYGEYEYGVYVDCVHVWVSCGGAGIVLNYAGYSGSNVFAIGALNGGPAATAEQPYTLFDSPGSLELATITHASLGIPPDSSVKITLVWE